MNIQPIPGVRMSLKSLFVIVALVGVPISAMASKPHYTKPVSKNQKHHASPAATSPVPTQPHTRNTSAQELDRLGQQQAHPPKSQPRVAVAKSPTNPFPTTNHRTSTATVAPKSPPHHSPKRFSQPQSELSRQPHQAYRKY